VLILPLIIPLIHSSLLLLTILAVRHYHHSPTLPPLTLTHGDSHDMTSPHSLINMSCEPVICINISWHHLSPHHRHHPSDPPISSLHNYCCIQSYDLMTSFLSVFIDATYNRFHTNVTKYKHTPWQW
jgi:hypothetical protein